LAEKPLPNATPNPGFEIPLSSDTFDGWEVKEFGHKAVLDFEEKMRGRASLRFDSTDKPQSSGLDHSLSPATISEYAFRFTGYVRTAELTGGASLYVVVHKADGKRYFDFLPEEVVSGNANWTRLELLIPKFSEVANARFGVLVWGHGSAWFDDLRMTSIDTNAPLSEQASTYLATALDTMEQNSIRRDSVNWPQVRESAYMLAAGSETTQDTYPAIEVAIRLLEDGHSHLYTPGEAKALQGDVTENAVLGPWVAPSGELLDSKIGYVSVPGFQGTNPTRTTRFADQLQAEIARLDSAHPCGWIVDLRNNWGGNVFAMLAGIGPLLGNGNAGGGVTAEGRTIFRAYNDGSSGEASISKAPYVLSLSHPPLAVLIGGKTASSGEALALAFIGKANTRTFGLPSAGATTGNSPFPLSDGAVLNLAITHMMDSAGKVYTGKIEPDVRVDSEGVDAAIGEATNWLNERCREASDTDR